MKTSTASLVTVAGVVLIGSVALVQRMAWTEREQALQREQQRLLNELAITRHQLGQLESENAALGSGLLVWQLAAAASAPQAGLIGAPALTALDRSRLGRMFEGAAAGADKLGPGSGQRLKDGLSRQVDRELAALTSRLGLSAQQQQQLRDVLQARSDRAGELVAQMLQGRMAPQDLQRLAVDRSDRDRSVRALLSAAQQPGFDAYLAEERQHKAAAIAHGEPVPARSAQTLDPEFQLQLAKILKSYRAAASAPDGPPAAASLDAARP